MRDDIWIERAALLEPFDGKGLKCSQVAAQTGLTSTTVKKYAAKFGFDFSCSSKCHEEPNKYEQRRSAVLDLASQDLTRHEIAERLDLNVRTVDVIGRELGIKFRHASVGRGVDKGRADAMAAMYRGGKTLNEIGTLFNISRERVRQILSKEAGLTAEDGGQKAASERKRLVRKSKLDAESFEKHGCSRDDYLALMRAGRELKKAGFPASKTPTGAFISQKNNAIGRGIEWSLKLWDWWQVWERSGKWNERGRARDAYVMCRFKDEGAYEVGNVYIATLQHNSSFQPNNPYRAGHPEHDKVMETVREKRRDRKHERRDRPAVGRHGLPVGVYFTRGRYRAQISISGKIKYLGSFDSAGLAERAVIDALRQDVRPAFRSFHTTPTVSEARR